MCKTTSTTVPPFTETEMKKGIQDNSAYKRDHRAKRELEEIAKRKEENAQKKLEVTAEKERIKAEKKEAAHVRRQEAKKIKLQKAKDKRAEIRAEKLKAGILPKKVGRKPKKTKTIKKVDDVVVTPPVDDVEPVVPEPVAVPEPTVVETTPTPEQIARAKKDEKNRRARERRAAMKKAEK